MTISVDARSENLRQALTALLSALGDGDIYEFRFYEQEFPRVLPTTWDELAAKGWLNRIGDPALCRLTGPGWIEALLVSGRLHDPVFRKSVEKLIQLVKSKSSRREDKMACALDFEAEGLSGAFVINAVTGDLLTVVFGDRRYTLQWTSDPSDSSTPFFAIPRNFGVSPTNT